MLFGIYFFQKRQEKNKQKKRNNYGQIYSSGMLQVSGKGIS